MYQRLKNDAAIIEKFKEARKQRLSISAEGGEGDFGDQTLNVVAGAALFTDPDVARFVNSLAIHATRAAFEQLKVDDGKERFAGAFEIHSLKAEVPTMSCFIFYRASVEARIKRLHKALKGGTLPGMENFEKLGITVGQFGLTKPYSRYGPGGEPYLHGNSDGQGGLDETKDWKSYKVPLKFPDTARFSDYKAGNSALATHLDDSAGLPFKELAALVCEMELSDASIHGKLMFTNELKVNFDSLDSLAKKFADEGEEAKRKATVLMASLLSMNTIYDVQNTKSAEFWRNFK